jgi:uncharacterized protein YjiS (DUF1127 family)
LYQTIGSSFATLYQYKTGTKVMTHSRNILLTFDDILNAREPIPPVAQVAFAISMTIMTWELRHRTRKALRKLEEHELNDVGIERVAACTEANRWFWQG